MRTIISLAITTMFIFFSMNPANIWRLINLIKSTEERQDDEIQSRINETMKFGPSQRKRFKEPTAVIMDSLVFADSQRHLRAILSHFFRA